MTTGPTLKWSSLEGETTETDGQTGSSCCGWNEMDDECSEKGIAEEDNAVALLLLHLTAVLVLI